MRIKMAFARRISTNGYDMRLCVCVCVYVSVYLSEDFKLN